MMTSFYAYKQNFNMICYRNLDTICIDSTHSSNMYDFNLIIITVIDEYREGIPVEWSSREDAMAMNSFLIYCT